MTAVKFRLLQATLISFLIGALAYGLDANPLFSIGAIFGTNVVLLADILAVAEVRIGTGSIEIRMRDDDE